MWILRFNKFYVPSMKGDFGFILVQYFQLPFPQAKKIFYDACGQFDDDAGGAAHNVMSATENHRSINMATLPLDRQHQRPTHNRKPFGHPNQHACISRTYSIVEISRNTKFKIYCIL